MKIFFFKKAHFPHCISSRFSEVSRFFSARGRMYCAFFISSVPMKIFVSGDQHDKVIEILLQNRDIPKTKHFAKSLTASFTASERSGLLKPSNPHPPPLKDKSKRVCFTMALTHQWLYTQT